MSKMAPMDFIPDYDPGLPSWDRMALLQQASDQLWEAWRRMDGFSDLTDRDVELLRRYVRDGSEAVREIAVHLLGEFGPVSFEDLEQWLLDPSETVRDRVAFLVGLSYTELGKLADSDKRHFVSLIGKAAELYEWMPVEAWVLCEENDDWLTLFWDEIGRLLDLGKEQLNGRITCGWLEDALVSGRVVPGDARLSGWITGKSVMRKTALLSVVQWFGMEEIWHRRIAEALAEDSDCTVSSAARCLLEYKG